MAQKLVALNWKENPRTEARAVSLFRETARINAAGVALAVCPPFIYLERIADIRRREKKMRIALGAQDVFWKEAGPYTSEVGPKMLRSLGVEYAIVGHSERRRILKETDAAINKKVRLALGDGLRVILCVGEPLHVRKKGFAAARRFVEGQLAKDLSRTKIANASRLAVAYEPIWAIGTGKNDKPEDAAAMADVIKSFLKKAGYSGARMLYGGSVNGANIADYIQYKHIDGVLVGGAGLHARGLKKIITAVAKVGKKKNKTKNK